MVGWKSKIGIDSGNNRCHVVFKHVHVIVPTLRFDCHSFELLLLAVQCCFGHVWLSRLGFVPE